MKRLLALLLIALLPLQSGWAAVAVQGMLCGTSGEDIAVVGHARQDAGGDHASHHAHHAHHVPDTAHAAPADCQELAQTDESHDGSCTTCHASCCTLTSTATALPAVAAIADAPATPATVFLPTPAQQRPERPKWPGLA